MKNTQAQRDRRAKLAQSSATDKQRKNLAKRKAMGPALVERPLRFIGAKINTVTMVDGKPKVHASWQFKDALAHAQAGFGLGVRRVAFEVLHAEQAA